VMPDVHNAGDATSQLELDGLAGRIGCAYVKQGLSPPFHLRDAVKHWRGLTQDEIVAVIEKHFEQCRRFYTAGCGDAHFDMVRMAVTKALEANHPLPRDEPVRPRLQRRAAGVRKIHHAGGTDIYDDRRDPDWIREVAQPRPAPPQSFRESGEPIGEDVESEADE